MLAPAAERSAAASAGDCRWCGCSRDAIASRLSGRIRCEGCGVAVTFPRPTANELDAAYGAWYRPPGGRFSGPGDAILRRRRGRLDRIAPAADLVDVGVGGGASMGGFRSGVVYRLETLVAGARLRLHRTGMLSSREYKDPRPGSP